MLSSTKKRYMFIIYELGSRGDAVRSIDISNALGVKKASVSLMLPNLIKENLIERTENGNIALTKEGAVFAGELYAKYLTVYNFFKEDLNSSGSLTRISAIVRKISTFPSSLPKQTELTQFREFSVAIAPWEKISAL